MEASDWFCVHCGVAKDDIISITPTVSMNIKRSEIYVFIYAIFNTIFNERKINI